MDIIIKKTKTGTTIAEMNTGDSFHAITLNDEITVCDDGRITISGDSIRKLYQWCEDINESNTID